METKYLGIDIGGTKIKSVIMDGNGQILEQNEVFTEDSASNPTLWKQKILELIEIKTKSYTQENKSRLRCGISAPGLASSDNRKIVHMPVRLNGLENLDWSQALNRDIWILNDGHSACLAEYHSFHKPTAVKNMLLLTLGTGVGGGVIIEGKLFQGALQRAGHFGHITVDHMGNSTMTNMVGSLEYAFGNFSVGERTQGRFESVKELVSAYTKGDTLATYWWLSSVQKLATGLASLTNAFAPELIVLGGGITAGAGTALFNPLATFMSLYEWRPGGQQVKLVQAKHGGYAGAIGAAYFAKSKIGKNNE